MIRIFRYILSTGRKRRKLIVSFSLWLLRMLYDVDQSELRRLEDEHDELNLIFERVSPNDSEAVEEKRSYYEYNLWILESAIEELGFAYEARF
ncbi:MAG: hypothetical protein FWE20_12340 [Defluviitaleaceae bacterium]|nr:hypothetical protein [Defluviitaleaceae bacterium]